MTGPPTIFGSAAFGRLLVERPLVALDIGARRGFVDDLLPIAAAVDAIGFEPDSDECECLNRTAQNQSGPPAQPPVHTRSPGEGTRTARPSYHPTGRRVVHAHGDSWGGRSLYAR